MIFFAHIRLTVGIVFLFKKQIKKGVLCVFKLSLFVFNVHFSRPADMAASSGSGILNFERLIFILLNGLYIALRPAIRRRITFRVISLRTSLFIPIHYFFTKNLPVSSTRHYYLGKYRRRTFHEYLWERYAYLISKSPPRMKLVCLKRDHNIDDSVN